ncbi:MAG TPA: hypothetical protein VNI77_11740, partial [Nitrososphaera sp.]|nr:hypothetical protein [Nitrososphaera sp.]
IDKRRIRRGGGEGVGCVDGRCLQKKYLRWKKITKGMIIEATLIPEYCDYYNKIEQTVGGYEISDYV